MRKMMNSKSSKKVKGYRLTFTIEGSGVVTRRFSSVLNGFMWVRRKYPDRPFVLKELKTLYD
jgi:hypothetical protein